MKEQKLTTPQQMKALFLVSAMAPAVRLIPAALLPWAGAGTWVGCLVSFPLCAGAALFTGKLWNSAEVTETAPEWAKRKLGRAGAIIVLVPVGIWLSLYAGFTLRTAAERLISTIYNNAGTLFFVAVTLAVSLWAALGCARTLGRMGSLMLPVLAILLLVTSLLGIGDIRWENLIPERDRIGGIPAAAIGVGNVCTLMIYSPLLMGECKREGRPQHTTMSAAAWLTIGTTVMSAAVIGALSSPLAQQVQNPYFLMVRNLSALGEKERIEAVVIAMWLVSDLVFIPTLLRGAGWALESIGKKRNLTAGVWGAGVLAAAGTLVWGGTALNKEIVSYKIVPSINLFFTVIWIPTAVLAARVREIRGGRGQRIRNIGEK